MMYCGYCSLYCRALCNTRNISEPQNPRFIIESGFKSRAGYNDTRRVGKLNAAYLKSLFNNTQAGARSFHFDKFVNLSKWHLRETLFVRLRHSKAFKVVIR